MDLKYMTQYKCITKVLNINDTIHMHYKGTDISLFNDYVLTQLGKYIQ